MKTTPEKPKRLDPLHWTQLEQMERPAYLVKRLLSDNGMSVVYGEPGQMKTFVALDLALHLARSAHWHGHRVKGGPVVYVACEGGRSIEDRLAAYCSHHEVERPGVPFYVIPQTVNLRDAKADLKPLTESIRAIGDVKLIVVDTLSRALVGGNENSPDDMGAFITCCDALRRKTGAHVMVIHHTGKDTARGARGHSSLKAATDTEIMVSKSEGVCVVKVTKQRDMPDGLEIGFKWHVVEVDEDEDGDPVTSLVLEPTDDIPAPEERLPKGAKVALDVLWKAIKSEGVPGGPAPEPPIDPSLHAIQEERWRVLCAEVPLSRGSSDRAANMAFTRAKERLEEDGKISSGQGWVWPWPSENRQVEYPF